jgi:hypothetical protein
MGCSGSRSWYGPVVVVAGALERKHANPNSSKATIAIIDDRAIAILHQIETAGDTHYE